MKRALAWVRRHGRTNREHPPLHPPRFLLSRTRFGSVNPAKDPSQSPVPLSLARARDLSLFLSLSLSLSLSQAFRRLNGLKRHTGAYLPVIPNSMHLRAETFPPHLTWICLWQVKHDCRTHERNVDRQRAVKSFYSKNEVPRFDFIRLNFYLNVILINIEITLQLINTH